MRARKLSGLTIATAAAGIFAALGMSGCATEPENAGPTVMCEGINACKGQGQCQTATNSCHYQNACKGKGWLNVTAEECKEKGGKII